MMGSQRSVWITGLGVVSAAGLGADALWSAVSEGRSCLGRIGSFDPSGFESRVGGMVPELDVRKFVPKTYRKATKVMARDIELAVVAADFAVRDAGLTTPGTDAESDRTYEGARSSCHIGAGLIAADLDELTEAMASSAGDDGRLDMHKWGSEGMNHLTPLWLLKYLPNMLACHVTIIHDSRGPSNTITCGEASGGLSIGESMRVIQRGGADVGFGGGAESKLNPMAFYRQQMTGRLVKGDDGAAVKPFDAGASGTALGEGGGLLILEAAETARQRGVEPYAVLRGFGASHTVYPEGRGLEPDPEGKGIGIAMRSALRDAGIGVDEVDAVFPLGSGIPAFDRAEAAAIKSVFGERAGEVEVVSSCGYVGNCGAGAGGVGAALAAMTLREQRLPARIHCGEPIDGLRAGDAGSVKAEVRNVMVVTPAMGGQNVALILGRAEG